MPGEATGSSDAGVAGAGDGSADTQSFSSSAEIPLGDSGKTLYSNLVVKGNRKPGLKRVAPKQDMRVQEEKPTKRMFSPGHEVMVLK